MNQASGSGTRGGRVIRTLSKGLALNQASGSDTRDGRPVRTWGLLVCALVAIGAGDLLWVHRGGQRPWWGIGLCILGSGLLAWGTNRLFGEQGIGVHSRGHIDRNELAKMWTGALLGAGLGIETALILNRVARPDESSRLTALATTITGGAALAAGWVAYRFKRVEAENVRDKLDQDDRLHTSTRWKDALELTGDPATEIAGWQILSLMVERESWRAKELVSIVSGVLTDNQKRRHSTVSLLTRIFSFTLDRVAAKGEYTVDWRNSEFDTDLDLSYLKVPRGVVIDLSYSVIRAKISLRESEVTGSINLTGVHIALGGELSFEGADLTSGDCASHIGDRHTIYARELVLNGPLSFRNTTALAGGCVVVEGLKIGAVSDADLETADRADSESRARQDERSKEALRVGPKRGARASEPDAEVSTVAIRGDHRRRSLPVPPRQIPDSRATGRLDLSGRHPGPLSLHLAGIQFVSSYAEAIIFDHKDGRICQWENNCDVTISLARPLAGGTCLRLASDLLALVDSRVKVELHRSRESEEPNIDFKFTDVSLAGSAAVSLANSNFKIGSKLTLNLRPPDTGLQETDVASKPASVSFELAGRVQAAALLGSGEADYPPLPPVGSLLLSADSSTPAREVKATVQSADTGFFKQSGCTVTDKSDGHYLVRVNSEAKS